MNKIIEEYAHDYRDIAMSEQELGKMLNEAIQAQQEEFKQIVEDERKNNNDKCVDKVLEDILKEL